jgi:hypothetical protein
MRAVAVALVLATFVVAAPAFADVPAPVAGPHAVPLVWSPAMIAKVKEQIAIHEGRAAVLQPIVARDTTAHDSLVADAAALEAAAKEEARQSADFRGMAATATDEKTRKEFLVFAAELETFAKHSEEGARTHREVARRLEDTIKAMQAAVTYHLNLAAKLKTALANNS